MVQALAVRSYITPECSMCQDAAPAKVGVVGNPEHFCSLVCCKIFYSRPAKWIIQHRREAS
jgi:hypothetical protein